MHAEAVLLVDDDEREARKLDILLKQRVGADDDQRVTVADFGVAACALSRGHTAGQRADRNAQRFEPR